MRWKGPPHHLPGFEGQPPEVQGDGPPAPRSGGARHGDRARLPRPREGRGLRGGIRHSPTARAGGGDAGGAGSMMHQDLGAVEEAWDNLTLAREASTPEWLTA